MCSIFKTLNRILEENSFFNEEYRFYKRENLGKVLTETRKWSKYNRFPAIK